MVVPFIELTTYCTPRTVPNTMRSLVSDVPLGPYQMKARFHNLS